MRWIENLENIVSEINQGTYKYNGTDRDALYTFDFYREQYEVCEEELSFEEAERVKNNLIAFRTALAKQFPVFQ